MPASIFGNPAAVVQLNQALFGIAPGNGKYTNQLDQANAVGAIPFARQLGQTVAATNEALAATVLANVGIVNATLQTALVQAFAAFPNDRGVVVLNLTNILTTLEGNAVYGAAAAQFNAQVATDFQYSTNPVNTQDSPVNAGTTTLTANTDVLTGNVFEAGLVFTPGGNDRINSLQDEDRLTGTGANATLNAALGNANDNGANVITPTLNNIATVNVAFTGSGAAATNTLDLQDATGLINLAITRISATNGAAAVTAQNIQTAGTNNLSIAGVQVPATVVFDYADGSLAAKDDTGTLNVAGVTLQSVTIDENSVNTTNGANQGFNTLNVRSTAANQINNLISGESSVLNLTATGGSLSIANFAGNVAVAAVGNGQPGANVAVGAGEYQAKGAASFANGGGVLSAINGADSTGAVTVDITGYEAARPNPQNSGLIVTTTVTGGSGNDRIISAGGIGNTALVINGGMGTNTLALYSDLLDNTPTDAIRPTITNIQNLEVRTQTGIDANIQVDVSAVGGLQNIFLRNENAAQAAAVFDLRELTQAQANAITINHSASRGNGINNGTDSTQVLVNLNDASGTTDSASLTLRSDLNNNNRFNVVFDAQGNAAAATVAAAGRGQGGAGVQRNVENITINDGDNESNAVELTRFNEHTGTITVTGGVAGQFMQLDATANAYRWDQSGNTQDGGTGSAAVTAINGRPTNGSRSDVDGGNAERLVSAVFDSSAYLGDVVIRVSDNAAAASLGGQRITFGAGNDTVIFDQITAGALNRNTAGLTISDTVAGGAGTDILGIDGHAAAVTITASEWTNVSGFEVIRTIGNEINGVLNGRGVTNAYNLTLTNDLLANNGATDGGVKRIIIVNDNDATNDAGQTDPARSVNDNIDPAFGATNNGQGAAGNIAAATGNESGITIDARTLSATNSFEYRGEEGITAPGVGSTADRFILADANINGSAIIDGGAASNVTAVTQNRDADSIRNLDVLEVRNSATVSAGDLANISNVGTLEFTNDTAIAQNSILVIDDAIVDRMVDAYQASRVDNLGLATPVFQNQERLVVKAIDNVLNNGGLAQDRVFATTGLTLQADSLTGRSAVDLFLGRGTHNVAIGSVNGAGNGGNDRAVILGNYALGAYTVDAVMGENLDAFANAQAGARNFAGTINLGGQTGVAAAGATTVDQVFTYGAINFVPGQLLGVEQIVAASAIVLTDAQYLQLITNATAANFAGPVIQFTGPGAHQLTITDTVGNVANIDLNRISVTGGTLTFDLQGQANTGVVTVVPGSTAMPGFVGTNPTNFQGGATIVSNPGNSPYTVLMNTENLSGNQAGDPVLTVVLGSNANNSTPTGSYNNFNANDVLQLNGAVATVSIAGINGGGATGFGTFNASAATAFSVSMTAAQHNGFTNVTGNNADDTITLTTAGTVTGSNTIRTYNLADGTNSFTTGGTAQQSVVGSNGADTFISSAANLVNKTINGAGGTLDSIIMTDAFTNAFDFNTVGVAGAAVTGVETINLVGINNVTVTTANGAGIVTTVNGAHTAAAVLQLGTGGQTVTSRDGATGAVTLTGTSVAVDTFNLSTTAVSNFGETIRGDSNIAAIDVVSNFNAVGNDAFGTGVAATTLNNLTIATAELSNLAAAIQTAAVAAGAALAANTQAYLVNVAAGGAAGLYAFQNDGATVTAVDATDTIIRLIGTTGAITTADFIV